MGDRGKTGHTGSDGSQVWDRIERYGKWTGSVAENISFGDTTGADYMIQLYIDDGVPNRGHRKNIMNANLKQTGIAYCSHSKYGGMLVVVFAGGFASSDQSQAMVAARSIN